MDAGGRATHGAVAEKGAEKCRLDITLQIENKKAGKQTGFFVFVF